MYTPDELGAAVTVTSEGEVVMAGHPNDWRPPIAGDPVAPSQPSDDETSMEVGNQPARPPDQPAPATDAQRDWYLKTMSVLGFNGEDRLDIAIDIGGDQFDQLPAAVLREIVQAARATLLTVGPDPDTGRVAWRIQQPGVAMAS
jgi:hypothetical protein